MTERILQAVYDAVDQVNATKEGPPLSKSPDTALFGDRGQLDSLGLINLIVAVEERIEDACGHTITLADDRALSQEISPFRTIGSLVEYVEVLVKEAL